MIFKQTTVSKVTGLGVCVRTSLQSVKKKVLKNKTVFFLFPIY